MTVSYKQVSLLPWLQFLDIQIGNTLFWKYDPDAITDKDNKFYLDNYVKCYIDKHQNPVKAVTVASYKDKNYFEPLSNEEYEELNFCRNILCFLCISEQSRIALSGNNFSMGPASADIFEMVSQDFIPGTDDIAVKSGSTTSGGWKLNDIHFQEPWSTGGFFKRVNREVHAAINKLISSTQHDGLKNRLLRSSELFRLAHLENGVVSSLFRVVMMATAFEIIFDIPNAPVKAGFLADKIDQTIAQSGFIQQTRKYGRNQDKIHSIAGWWGWDFYKLRNSIVHGDNIPQTTLIYSDWITHVIVADTLYYSYIVFLLQTENLMDTGVIPPDFNDIYTLLNWMLAS